MIIYLRIYFVSKVVIPSNKVDNWQTIRKKQWKYVKGTLRSLSRDSYDIKKIKPHYVDGFESNPNEMFNFFPEPIIQFWLYADQSGETWNDIWDEYISVKQNFSRHRELFLYVANLGEVIHYSDGKEALSGIKQVYGAFGGLEEQMLKYMVPTEVYTDDMIEIHGENFRKVPWETPQAAFLGLISRIISPFRVLYTLDKRYVLKSISPFYPYQWMIPMFESTFDYDIQSSFDKAMTYIPEYMLRLKLALSDRAEDLLHPNHIETGLKLIKLFEDKSTPSYIRELWLKVKDDKYDFKNHEKIDELLIEP